MGNVNTLNAKLVLRVLQNERVPALSPQISSAELRQSLLFCTSLGPRNLSITTVYIPTPQDFCTQFQGLAGPGRVTTLYEFSWVNHHIEGMNLGVLDIKLPGKMAGLCSGAKKRK